MRKLTHPLALLRFILGKTQAKFAESLGVTKGYIDKIERGERQISPRVSRRLQSLYGWVAGDLNMVMPDPEDAAAVGRTIYAKWKSWEAWKNQSVIDNGDAMKAFYKYLRPAFRGLIEKAQRRNTASALLLSFESWMSDAARDFGLGPFKPVYSKGAGGRVKHSSGGIVFRVGAPDAPMPDHIQKAVQPYFDALNGAKMPAATPECAKAGKQAGSAKRSRRRAA